MRSTRILGSVTNWIHCITSISQVSWTSFNENIGRPGAARGTGSVSFGLLGAAPQPFVHDVSLFSAGSSYPARVRFHPLASPHTDAGCLHRTRCSFPAYSLHIDRTRSICSHCAAPAGVLLAARPSFRYRCPADFVTEELALHMSTHTFNIFVVSHQ